MYLRANDVTKSYGDRRVLSGVSLVVNDGERVALVGPNGSGKSTLLRILAGLERPDSGTVDVSPATLRVGYLPQKADTQGAMIVADAVGSAGAAWAMLPVLEAAADKMSQRPDATREIAEYSRLWEAFEEAGGYPAAGAMADAMLGLGVGGLDPDCPLSALSGGMRTRLALAGLLAARPEVLLLDEPTNHLDIPALEWLEGFVTGYPGAVVVVSHDRVFLDRVAQRVVEIDPSRGTLSSYAGNYTAYAEAKTREMESQRDAYERQQKRVGRLESTIRSAESRARGIEQRTIHFYYRTRARKIARSAVVQKRRLERELDREGRLEKPAKGWTVKADLAASGESGLDVLVARDVVVCYGDRTVLHGASLHVRRGERLIITGSNGSGKTTLLRAIVGQVTPSSGTIRLGAGVVLGYFAQEQDNLDLDGTPIDVVRSAASMDETEARRFLHRFLFSGDDVFVEARKLSYGERARLLLAKLILSGANLLILDEPLSHLDLPSRERFESALLEFQGTLVAVLHDRYAIDRLATRMVNTLDGRLEES